MARFPGGFAYLHARRKKCRAIIAQLQHGEADERRALQCDMSKYVSDELTHFAGAGRANDAERYDLLLNTIIRSGTLRDLKYESVPKTPITFLQIDKRDGTSARENYFPDPYFDVNIDAPITSNKFVDPEMICFCDIPDEPVELFRIHTAKYKRFGIAFKREFLIRQGANPVFYVATSSATPLRIVGDGGELCDFFEDESIESLVTRVWNRSEFFDCLRRRVIGAIELTRTLWEHDAARYRRGVTDPRALKQRLYEAIDFPVGIFAYVFGYVKFFDPSLPDDDPNNFYMEREWRVLGQAVRFTVGDIARLYLPPEYSNRLRSDLPEYLGPITELPPLDAA